MASLERGRVPSPRPIAAREIPLIDRVEEMNVLKEAVYKAVHGEGSLIFIHGEAGIGKTRLVRELGAYVQSRGVRVLYGRCPALFRMDGVPPYVLWKEVIKDYLETCSSEQLYRVIGYYPAEVAKLVPELSQKLRAFPQSFPISPEQEQNRLFEAVSQFITNISQETPLLVVLDDLQWTDSSSLLLLHYLARGAQKTPLLLVGAYRSTDIDSRHPLTPVLTELKRERLPQSVSLKRMSSEDISEMIRQILKQDDIPAEFCRMVYEKTRGNPFFAEEVIESLKEEEIIYREGDNWKFKEISKIEFPESVKNVVKARLSRLDDECQNILTWASFIGNDFTLEAMSALTGIEENKLLELMDRMLKTGLIKEREVRGEGVCSFADILVRDVVYEEVSLLKRKKLHGVVGCALEKVYAKTIDEHLGELASHFLESGDKDKALDYFLKAGEKASKVYAHSEAVSYFQSALRLLEEKEGESQEKARVHERLGDIKNTIGEYEVCMKFWNDALLAWEHLREEKEVSRLHVKMGKTLWERMGKAEEAKQHHDKALKLLEGRPESVELAWLYEDIAERISMRGHEGLNEARSWAEKALELAKKLNDQRAIAQSYCVFGEVLGWLGDINAWIAYMEKALKIALDNNFVEQAVFAYTDLGSLYSWWRYETSFNLYTKGLELAKKVGDLFWVSWFETNLVETYIGLGDMEKATATAEESFAVDKKTSNRSHLPRSILARGWIHQIKGEWDKSEQLYNEALTISCDLDDYQGIMMSNGHLGRLHLDKGEYTKATEYYVKNVEIAERHEVGTARAWASLWLLNSCIESKELEKAKKLLEYVHKYALESNDELMVKTENLYRAKLLRAEGKLDESVDQFERSLKEWEALNARRWDVYWFAKTVLYEYARTYLERDKEGDREKARSLLNEALEIFQKLGANKEIEITMKIVETLQHPTIQISQETISPRSHELAGMQSGITATPTELKVGESLELEIEITNTRKEGIILLTKIIEIIPEDFTVARKPEPYRVEGNCLNLKEKRLEPSKKEEVKLILTPKIRGTFHIQPKIIYLDENGKEKTCEPKPISVTVKELGIKGWIKGER
nr:AAA family ATPase [Candidatus Njordarchaeum guaymaensis]